MSQRFLLASVQIPLAEPVCCLILPGEDSTCSRKWAALRRMSFSTQPSRRPNKERLLAVDSVPRWLSGCRITVAGVQPGGAVHDPACASNAHHCPLSGSASLMPSHRGPPNGDSFITYHNPNAEPIRSANGIKGGWLWRRRMRFGPHLPDHYRRLACTTACGKVDRVAENNRPEPMR